MSNINTFEWTVKISISKNWIVDGFRVTAENVQDAILKSLLQDAYPLEVKVEVVSAPKTCR